MIVEFANGSNFAISRLVVGVFFAFVIAVQIGFTVLYRLTLHPLAKYPGPFWAKITDFYSVYHSYKGDRHLEFFRCHEKYGNVFRFGPNSLSFNTSSALKEIYERRANVQKSKFYMSFPPKRAATSTHNSINKTRHARKRRVLSHGFSDAALKTVEEYILKRIRLFCAILAEKPQTSEKTKDDKNNSANNRSQYEWSIPRNLAEWANYLTFDIMGELCFGKSFDMLEKPDNHFAIGLLEASSRRSLVLGCYIPLLRFNLDRLLFPRLRAPRKRYQEFSKAQMLERLRQGTSPDQKDLFAHLFDAKDPETGIGFTTEELWAESNTLIIAGSDTSSTALSSTIFYLLHNPRTLDQLNREVRTTFKDVEDIHSGPTLTSCSYLRACIDEAMRLSPPVGGILAREVLPGGIIIDNQFIPPGTDVGVPIYAIQHNADYYPLPFQYSPERWLADISGEENVKKAHDAFCPFSIGPRGCIGKGLAYIELTSALARILWLFDMRLAPGSHAGEGSTGMLGRERIDEYQLEDIFTSKKNGPIVQFREREIVEI